MVLRLSSKVRVIISRTIVGGALDHSVVLLSSGSDSTPHSSQELRKECTAQNKWERTNPGAACWGHSALLRVVHFFCVVAILQA